jgi:hypothetical protein
MILQTQTTELEGLQDSILPAITAALATTTQLPGKPHNTLVMGRACFLRVPESEANDLNFLLCRCNETGYASRLGNNEIQPLIRIGLNSVMKNRAPNNPIKPNPMGQRRAGRWC